MSKLINWNSMELALDIETGEPYIKSLRYNNGQEVDEENGDLDKADRENRGLVWHALWQLEQAQARRSK